MARIQIEGFAIVSADGMIADAAGDMPPSLINKADQEFFYGGLARAAGVVNGRYSKERDPGADGRRRVVVTRRVAAVAPHPGNSKAVLWNPAGAPLEAALEHAGIRDGVLAVIGGTEVFGLFLDRYDRFHLTRANRARLPGGRPVFPEVPKLSVDEVLTRHGLAPRETSVLDVEADVTLTVWERH
jgi:dihydrofolate reductase